MGDRLLGMHGTIRAVSDRLLHGHRSHGKQHAVRRHRLGSSGGIFKTTNGGGM